MRWVTPKPPNTLMAAKMMAAMPATCATQPSPLRKAMPVALIAPTMVTPDSAFMPDISGVCSRLGTVRMMKYPSTVLTTNTANKISGCIISEP